MTDSCEHECNGRALHHPSVAHQWQRGTIKKQSQLFSHSLGLTVQLFSHCHILSFSVGQFEVHGCVCGTYNMCCVHGCSCPDTLRRVCLGDPRTRDKIAIHLRLSDRILLPQHQIRLGTPSVRSLRFGNNNDQISFMERHTHTHIIILKGSIQTLWLVSDLK